MSGADTGSDLFSETRLHRAMVVTHYDRVKGHCIFDQLFVSPAPNCESGEEDDQNEAYKSCNTEDDSR